MSTMMGAMTLRDFIVQTSQFSQSINLALPERDSQGSKSFFVIIFIEDQQLITAQQLITDNDDLLSTGSGRHSAAAHEIRLIGCCILLNVVPKTVPLSGSSQSPLDCLSPFSRLASLKAMRLLDLLRLRP